MNKLFKVNILGYVAHFSLIHVPTYVIGGLIFMKLQNYRQVFSESELFINYRSLDSLSLDDVKRLKDML